MNGIPIRHGGESQSGSSFGRQILEAVDREIGPAIEHRSLYFASEDADAAHRCQRSVPVAVTFRRNVNDLDVAVAGRVTDQIGDVVRLPQGELAGSRGNPDHSAGGIAHGQSV